MEKDNFNKGFTLVELLAVLAILALLAVIAFPTIIGTISKATDKATDIQIDNLNRSVKQFVADNAVSLGDKVCISVKTLQTLGYVGTGDIVDSNNNNYNDSYYNITWDETNNQYKYNLSSNCNSSYIEYE